MAKYGKVIILFGQEAFSAPGGLEACGRADEFPGTAQAYLKRQSIAPF